MFLAPVGLIQRRPFLVSPRERGILDTHALEGYFAGEEFPPLAIKAARCQTPPSPAKPLNCLPRSRLRSSPPRRRVVHVPRKRLNPFAIFPNRSATTASSNAS